MATARRGPALEALGAVITLALLVCCPPSGAAADTAAAAAATRGGPAALESGLPLGPAPFLGLAERRLALDNSEEGVALDEPINPLSVGRARHGVPFQLNRPPSQLCPQGLPPRRPLSTSTAQPS